MFVWIKRLAMKQNSGPRTHPKENPKDNSKEKRKPADGVPRLADYLCFAIYSANLAYGRAYKKGLDALGLTYPQWIALVSLWEEDHQTVGELGARMFLESNTLTPMLKKLEQIGYLRRQRDVETSVGRAGYAVMATASAVDPAGVEDLVDVIHGGFF